MRLRYHGTILLLLAVAFLGVTVLKYAPASDLRNHEQGPSRPDSLQTSTKFWSLYRAATDARTAGRYDRAVRLYQNALRRRPDHRDARFYLGNTLLQAGRLKKAARQWRALIDDHPKSTRVRGQLAGLYLCSSVPDLRNLNQARRHFRAIIRLHGEETAPLVRLAQLALLQGRPDRARRALEPLTEREALPPTAAFLRGYLAWRSGRSRTATLYLARTREALGPSVPEKTQFRVPPSHQNEGCKTLDRWRSLVEETSAAQAETEEIYSRFQTRLREARLHSKKAVDD